jgi:hypothetical protein
MTPHDRARVSLAAARYLDALERDDQDALDALWAQAAADPELLAAFNDINAGLLEEAQSHDQAAVGAAVAKAIAEHLRSAEVVKPEAGPVTVADVAEELFRHPPERLPAEVHALNERLRSATDVLPVALGLADLVSWAEARFGAAPAPYWEAFRKAALKARMRRAADAEFQLAARKTARKSEGGR